MESCKKIRLIFFQENHIIYALQGTVGIKLSNQGYVLPTVDFLPQESLCPGCSCLSAGGPAHFLCKDRLQQSTSLLKASANLCPKQSMPPKALFSSKLQIPFLSVEIPLPKACVCWAGGRTCPSSAGSAWHPGQRDGQSQGQQRVKAGKSFVLEAANPDQPPPPPFLEKAQWD